MPLKYKNINLLAQKNEFLNNEFWSFNDTDGDKNIDKEILEDRNMYTKCRYQNIFELRHIKLRYLIEDLPKKVKNYIFIRYEDLIDNFEDTMFNIQKMGLKKNNNNLYYENVMHYKKENNIIFDKKSTKENFISKDEILNNPNLIPYYENKLGYIKTMYS